MALKTDLGRQVSEASEVRSKVSEETPIDTARRSNPGSEYGITRNRRGGSRYWQVNLKRQGRHFCRVFYDSIYGDAETALAEARAYRDALMAAFAPSTNAQMAEHVSKKDGGMSGVYEMHGRTGKLTGYRVVISTQGELKQRVFSIAKYGPNGARLSAEAQRETWVAERMLQFMVRNSAAMHQAMKTFPEHLANQLQAVAAETTENDINQRLRVINADFDARRPRIFTVSVRHYAGKRLMLRVSDGGVPVVAAQASLNYARIGLKEALKCIGDQAAAHLREFFGRERGERFLNDHGAAFEAENFDIEKGIEIRERP